MLEIISHKRTVTAALSLAAALGSSVLHADTVYQWKDEQGRTVFSQRAPADSKAVKVPKKIGKPTAPASLPPPVAPTRPAAPPAQASAPRPLSDEDKAKLARSCEQARTALRVMQEHGRSPYINEQGQRVYMSPEMKAERTADAERKAAEYCREP